MSVQTERYIVAEKVAEDVKKFRVGFSQFDKLCRNSTSPVKAVLLVPDKDNIDDGSSLAAFLRRYNSREIIDDLREGRDVILPCGVPFSLATYESFSDSGDPLVILAVNASSEILAKLDESQNIQAVIVVPDDAGDVEEWARQWGPSAVSDY